MSFLTDGINWENKKFVLRAAVTENGVSKPEEIAIGYGKLFEASVDFLIVGITVFMVVKLMNRLKDKAHDTNDKTIDTPKDIELLHKISDQLERQSTIMESKGSEK